MTAATPSESRLRQELLAIRQQLLEARIALREQHDRGLPSVQVCGKLTSSADAAILRLMESALEEIPTSRRNAFRQRIALVAHGGYGRRQLAPFSDIDLMIVYRGRQDDDLRALARRLTQDVFDVGLQLGQSLRSIDEALRLARQDPIVCTSLIESRLVCGSLDIFQPLSSQFEKMVRKRCDSLSASFVESRRQERANSGETVFLLEPNVKRSRGALRDMHLLRWLWFSQVGVSDIDRLRTLRVLSKFDHHRLVNSRDFLLRVRNDLHFESGKARDTLTRAEQVRIAEKFHYRGKEGLLPVEQFMRDYFRHASHIAFLAARMSELTAKTPLMTRALETVFSRNIEQDYRVGVREINATQPGRSKLAHRLEEAVRLVDLARLSDRRIAQEAWYQVYRAAPKYSVEESPAALGRFLAMLDNPVQLGESLRRLHALGVLEKLLPEFAHARCLLQFNQYHKYTVDEHCIRAVEEATRFAERQDELGATYRKLSDKRTLHLALLIHDLGKGREEDHSEVGERVAIETASRFHLEYEQSRRLVFLVRMHLSMNRLAFRRDTSDPEMIAAFAEEVRDPKTLTLLYLLSCADLAGVGPDVLNAWKVGVLTDLYRRTLEALQPNQRAQGEERRLALRKAAWDEFQKEERDDPWFQSQFHALPETILASRSAEAVVALLRRLHQLHPRGGDAWGEHRADHQTTEFVAGVDQGSGRGIFSSMAGALTAAGLRILTAETVLLERGLLLLRYVTEESQSSRATSRERIDAIAWTLVDAIDSDQAPTFQTLWGADQQHHQAKLTNLPHDVRLNDDLSESWLIVEVFTIDRRGLLYELARAIHDLDLVIRLAKVGTYVDQVVDVFYVSERDGAKPNGTERNASIRERILSIIEEPSKETP